MHALAPREVVELGAAAEPVGQHHRVGPRLPHRRQELLLGHRHRHVVVPLLDPEVAGQAAASAQPDHLGPRALQQGRVRAPAEDGGVVAVRLRDDLDAGQVRRGPALGAVEQLGERQHSPGDAARRVRAEQVDHVVAQRRRAAGLQADDRDALHDIRIELADRLGQDPPGAVELARRDPREAAADLAPGDDRRVAGGPQHGHRVDPDLGREVLHEAVDEDHDRPTRRSLGGRVGAVLGEPPAEGLLGEPRQRTTRVHAGGLHADLGHAGSTHERVGDPRALARQSRPRGQPPQRVVRRRAQPPAVGLVQHLGLVGRHVDAGRAVRGAALAGQAQVEGLVHLGRAPVLDRRERAQHLLQGAGAAAGGVLLLPGREV